MMKKVEDPYYHLAPRAMKYEEDIEAEIRNLITPEIEALDIAFDKENRQFLTLQEFETCKKEFRDLIQFATIV